MRTELPIACTLNADEMAERGAQLAELGQDTLTGVDLKGTRAVLRFRDARERVDWLVEVESRCCNFLEFDVTQSVDETTLRVTAPDGAERVLREWVAAIAGDRIPA